MKSVLNVLDKAALELVLEKLKDFEKPVEDLEQYRTPGDLASQILWDAYIRGDIPGKIIVDLGCGTGVLTYGSLLIGADNAVCLDIDWEALKVAGENLKEFRGMFDLVAGDAGRPPLRPRNEDCVVVMNSPFGVKKRGADIMFLKAALKLCSRVYSIHKYTPRGLQVIARTAEEKGYSAMVISAEFMKLKPRYSHHRKRVHRFKVALIRFTRN